MLAFAGTTISLLAGSTVTDAGDEEEADDVKAKSIPASIRLGRQMHRHEATQKPRRMQYATMRLDRSIDLTGVTRVRDERTGDVWMIDENFKPQGSPIPADQIVNLKRTL